MAAEIDGEVAECRTRLTSRFPSADHRSTVSTKKEVSISLRVGLVPCFRDGPDGPGVHLFVDRFLLFHAGAREIERGRGGGGERDRECQGKKNKPTSHSLDVDLLLGGCISNDQPNAWGRGDGSSVLRVVGSVLSAVGILRSSFGCSGKTRYLVSKATHARSHGLL